MSQVAKHRLLLYDLGQLFYWAIVLIPYKKLAKSAAYVYSNNLVTSNLCDNPDLCKHCMGNRLLKFSIHEGGIAMAQQYVY